MDGTPKPASRKRPIKTACRTCGHSAYYHGNPAKSKRDSRCSHSMGAEVWEPEKGCPCRKYLPPERCKACGSDSLFSGFFGDDDLARPDDKDGAKWRTFCNDCGEEWK